MLPTIKAPVFPAERSPRASSSFFNTSKAMAMEDESRPLKMHMAGSSVRMISEAVKISIFFGTAPLFSEELIPESKSEKRSGSVTDKTNASSGNSSEAFNAPFNNSSAPLSEPSKSMIIFFMSDPQYKCSAFTQ